MRTVLPLHAELPLGLRCLSVCLRVAALSSVLFICPGLSSDAHGGGYPAVCPDKPPVVPLDPKAEPLKIFEPGPTMDFPDWMPSLLGRDIIHEFALFMENRTDQVLLLDANEASSLNLPSS